MNRRDFLLAAGSAGVMPAMTVQRAGSVQDRPGAIADRELWLDVVRKLSDPG